MSVDSLLQISRLAHLMKNQARVVLRCTEELQAAKEMLRTLSEEDLPELMRELMLTEVRLEDGSAIKVTDDVEASISVERRAEAHAWLIANGFGGIIKTSLSVAYERGERAKAEKDAESISRAVNRAVAIEEGVHSQTLRAFVRERLATGEPFPMELFGVRPFSRAKLTEPNAKAFKVSRATGETI